MGKTNILLESGTNELEIIEMKVGKIFYSVNVAKVREIVFPVKALPVPKMHESIEGIFNFRGTVIPVINLQNFLTGIKIKETQKVPTSRYIIMEFNQLLCAFRVDHVYRIRRISWNKIEAPGDMVSDKNSTITGIIKLMDELSGKERMIMMLDFERIIAEIEPETSFTDVKVELGEINRGIKRIIVAEDSKMIRNTLVKTLKSSGYTKVTACENGGEAWKVFGELLKEHSEDPNWNILKEFDLMITDIEMPLLDGHALTKKIKTNEKLQGLPVIIFSSLSNEENIRKGKSVGANGQISKPQISELVELVDNLIEVEITDFGNQ